MDSALLFTRAFHYLTRQEKHPRPLKDAGADPVPFSSFGFSLPDYILLRKGDEAMFKSFSMDLAGRTLTVEVGRVAKQANGAAFMHYGDTVVLSTATASDKPRDGIDFFPLSVEFEEKLYAVGKIPGGFTQERGKGV